MTASATPRSPVSDRPARRPPLVGLALLLALTAGTLPAQTVYRIVGPDGKVSFTDKPPPPNARASAAASAAPAGGAQDGAALPYELRQVTARYPATLYTSKDCVPCDSGRQLLRQRGVPFAEKTVQSQDDADALQRLSGSNSLPLLTLGAQQIKGFSTTEWTQYLSAAGYPEKSQLPAGHRNPEPAPMVAVQVAPATSAPVAASPELRPAPATPPARPTTPRINPDNPAGIQF